MVDEPWTAKPRKCSDARRRIRSGPKYARYGRSITHHFINSHTPAPTRQEGQGIRWDSMDVDARFLSSSLTGRHHSREKAAREVDANQI
ncbi:hypothetical protein GGTG_01842 [Gaeumannomyces tritici R3-111a-1]|uniref:Uncharacterized protein n=1 Tax=Gaeumannomyces tritici (strain R3-111a-1) TaxID=644352 RepID=J3NKQ1_GAET3|nr:hypothetical protein GGTG_01842 [Gaeumannomyces tritici R3-111a-1]EJT81868.1 hypothetical protein GGTG_01842 [Gaeumannomyces tritici R3-111a-1]